MGDDLSHHFDHGTKKSFDLIVGGDGAWSKMRPLLSKVQPFYSGIGGVTFVVDDTEKRHPDLYKTVNKGSIFAFSDCNGLTAQHLGDGSINAGTWSYKT